MAEVAFGRHAPGRADGEPVGFGPRRGEQRGPARPRLTEHDETAAAAVPGLPEGAAQDGQLTIATTQDHPVIGAHAVIVPSRPGRREETMVGYSPGRNFLRREPARG
ncbi:hypothetical protein GCM10017786_69190 [Amycolatopsis deserti]|uniref:Uncharacterized protein n=1 Tax=Amycolatopsis deserti TaxID=185696 RepID=A0ABQ3JDZ3_9PSEU|nr:hypothetical protein GCM10017786_69190 [Amycolatopsis deserti]